MIVTQTTPPAYLPMSAEEIKIQGRIDHDAEDELLLIYQGAAVDTCQQLTGRSIMAQAWRLTIDEFSGQIKLPWPAIQAIQSVQYKDTDGTTQTLATSVYELVGDAVCLIPGQQWPEIRGGSGSVWVNYTAGYSAGNEAAQQTAVPAGIKAWLLLTIGTLYANRESVQTGVSVSELPGRFTDTMLDRFKVY